MKYIKLLSEITQKDQALFGGKNAALGEMIQNLSQTGILVPSGFAISSAAYVDHIKTNNIDAFIRSLLHKKSTDTLNVSRKIRKHIEEYPFSQQLITEVTKAYEDLSQIYHQKEVMVAVRSSGTAEDLPGASFAGQHESFLAIRGISELLEVIKKSMSSLFTPRAIVYRQKQGFDSLKVGMSIGVQKMVMAGKAASGVGFSIDTETGFKEIIMIEAAYGFGETIVQGAVIPDLFVFHKTLLLNTDDALIKKQKGTKEKKMVLVKKKLQYKKTTHKEQQSYALTEQEGTDLAKMILLIEKHYSKKYKTYTPMDVEWAKDAKDQKIYIIQARPETVSQKKQQGNITQYVLEKHEKPIASGQSVGSQIIHGTVAVVKKMRKKKKNNQNNLILVTEMTSPDLLPLIKNVSGIITQQGGRTCHAAIVSRELNIPAIVGVTNATKLLKEGTVITLDCSQGNEGYIYAGFAPFTKKTYQFSKQTKSPVPLLVNISNPESAFSVAQLPISGVGLLRIEFIIATTIGIHPMACIFPKKLDQKTKKQIREKMGSEYKTAKEFFTKTLSRSISQIVASFSPRPVTIRFSDFKTNEYRQLIGGIFFESQEENPMLGFRGASRYYDEFYSKAFLIELESISYLITAMNLSNIKLLIPFVRTPEEAKKVTTIIKKYTALAHLPIYMMIEIPSNLFSMQEYATIFDGFSIGSNDLFQLFSGVDRDTAKVASLFSENDTTFLSHLQHIIEGAKKHQKPISICGQAPSDFPEVADFLIQHGITEISLNPDSVMPFLQRYEK